MANSRCYRFDSTIVVTKKDNTKLEFNVGIAPDQYAGLDLDEMAADIKDSLKGKSDMAFFKKVAPYIYERR